MFQIMDAACVMRSKRLNEAAAAERALRSCAGLGIAFEGMERNSRDSWQWNATLWERNACA